MKNKIDTQLDWKLYLTRPYNLFFASIWYAWYKSEGWTDFFQLHPPTSLLVEQPNGLVNKYWLNDELVRYNKIKRNLILDNRQKIINAYQEAHKLNEQSRIILEKGPSFFKNLEEAFSFFCRLAALATVLPYTVLEAMDYYSIDDKDLLDKSQMLRNISYYPDLREKIILPIARDHFKNIGLADLGDKVFDLLTYDEVITGKTDKVPERLQKREDKNYFILQYNDGVENVSWERDPIGLISKIEGIDFIKVEVLKGSTAFGGKVKGKVRVILKQDEMSGFKEGEIFVTVNSNPSFVPALKKSNAIVTDEGGIMCHAAIVARELKKPCIIGTKIATKVLKDGDIVEVNADVGVVRKIK